MDTLDNQENLSPEVGKEVNNAGSSGNEAWYSGLSEEYRNNPTVQKYKTADEQVKAHLELAKVFGGNQRVPLPKDDDDTLGQELFNKAIGVPQEASGYELNPNESMVEGGFDVDEFKNIMHKNGLTPKQAQGVLDEYGVSLENTQRKADQEEIEQINSAKSDLTREWGLQYDQNIKLAQNVMNKYAGEDFEQINSKIGNDPVALKFLANVGKQFSEGSLGDLGGTSGRFTMSPQQAKDEHSKIMSDPNDVYWSGVRNQNVVSERQRRERVQHVESLLKMANAGN